MAGLLCKPERRQCEISPSAPACQDVCLCFLLGSSLTPSTYVEMGIYPSHPCVFLFLRNRRSSQVLHSQALELSLYMTSLTDFPDFSAFPFLNLRIFLPAHGFYLLLS